MTEKIDIAEILKDKPANTKLYSPLFGEVYFSHVGGGIAVEHHGGISLFFSSGRFFDYDESEPLLFPSKEMRDWRKFAWKKGDVLVSNDGKLEVIFEKFGSDTYQSFIGKHHLDSLDENLYYQDGGAYPTASFNIETEDAAQTYIKTIEEKLDGILNLESLEIENAHPEYKDGDIVYMGNAWNEYIGIIKNRTSGNQIETYAHCHKDSKEEAVLGLWLNKNDSDELRLATNSEKQQLFDALAEEGKAWDSDKKQIVDLPKKCEFKVFEKVLVRESKTDEWTPNFFFKIHRDDERYVMVCGDMYNYCIPYNEETSHLLGTTDEWKGGEG
jgi:hypothetical protein